VDSEALSGRISYLIELAREQRTDEMMEELCNLARTKYFLGASMNADSGEPRNNSNNEFSDRTPAWIK